jgi:putative ABC transport system permease protein
MFGLKLTEGNSKQVLDGPDKMIVSESMAKKYFGNEEPVGKKLIKEIQDQVQAYEVTGVFKDYPANSHLDIKYLVSWSTFDKYLRAQGDTVKCS